MQQSGSESADVHHNNRKNPALSAQLWCDAGGKTGGAESTDHFKQYIPQGKLRIKDQHQIGGCHNQKDSEHTDDGGLAERVLWDRVVEGSFGMVCCCGIDAGEQDKKVVVLMPPPVDAGEAPINISPETTSRPAVEKSLRL